MPSWNSAAYLKFSAERTRPAIDLTARIVLEKPRHIIDLGCGPGNSTAVLAQRWPTAHLTGLDSSPAMIAAARRDFPQSTWFEGDIGQWSATAPFDLVFSNAALQWVPDHTQLLPSLLTQVEPGGALAFQVPANLNAPAHQLMRDLAASPTWRSSFSGGVREWHVHDPERYYEILAPRASRIDLWTTDYLHVLSGPDEIVEWYRGTGLRPWLDALTSETERARFLVDYSGAIASAYPRQTDGNVLFPFRRFFAIAYR